MGKDIDSSDEVVVDTQAWQSDTEQGCDWDGLPG